MCFSATASFVAGGVLSAGGVATLRTAKKKELPLASIPLLFGIQQLTDGVVWITPATSLVHIAATYSYSVLAFALWPVFTPFAVLLVETNPYRRKVLTALLVIGVLLAAFYMNSILFEGVRANLLRNCIAYSTPHQHGMLALAFYLFTVCGSFLVSGKRILRLFGVTLLISFAVAGWFYQVTFSSTWCFFAALLSAILFIYFNKKH